ncbi:MAG: hypothetical protein J5800_06275, partial [Spirochaetales bacterium]|nr:hypothetical protein [Spirochaetales bacterium]
SEDKAVSVGYVFYDKGYYSDGWRYLEAAPADLRVVNGLPTVDSHTRGYASAPKAYVFGYCRSSDESRNNYVGRDSKAVPSTPEGKIQTKRLVEAMGDMAYTQESGAEKTGDYAARLCSILEYEFDGVVYDDWFLPSLDDLDLMYETLYLKGIGGIEANAYHSSTEYSSIFVYILNFNSGGHYSPNRFYSDLIRPIRAF